MIFDGTNVSAESIPQDTRFRIYLYILTNTTDFFYFKIYQSLGEMLSGAGVSGFSELAEKGYLFTRKQVDVMKSEFSHV